MASFVFELELLSSMPAAKAFLDELETSPSVEAREFKAWGRALLALAQGGDPAPAALRIGEPSPFGFSPRARLSRAVQRRTNYGDNTPQRGARLLVPFLDTRPVRLETFATVAWYSLFDVRIGERYRREVSAAGLEFTTSKQWWALRSKDEPTLRALWKERTLGASGRIEALGVLEKMGRMSGADADAEIDRFLAESDDWPARDKATVHLITRGRHEHARRIVKDWLSRHEGEPGLEPVNARVRLAESFETEKRWADALAEVKPAIESMAFDPMAHAACLEAHLGKRTESLELAGRILARYPSASAMYVGAEVRWLARDLEGAAQFLAHPPPEARLRNADWQDFGGAFIASFAGAPEDAKKAIDALLVKGIAVENVLQMGWQVWRKNEAELAFSLVSRPPPPGDRSHHIGRLVNAYTMMRVWKTEQAAAEWLRSQVKPEESSTLAMFAMELGEEPILWNVAAESGAPDDIERLWALRAASTRRTVSLVAKLGDVRAHYEGKAASGGRWDVVGRYLAGLADDAAIATLARDPRSSAEIAFYMGARAEGEGRFDDANDFYRVSLEADVRDSKESAQARATLGRWKSGSVLLAKVHELPFPEMPASKL